MTKFKIGTQILDRHYNIIAEIKGITLCECVLIYSVKVFHYENAGSRYRAFFPLTLFDTDGIYQGSEKDIEGILKENPEFKLAYPVEKS